MTPSGDMGYRTWIRNSLVTWDAAANAGYLTVCRDPEVDPEAGCCHSVGRTVDLGGGTYIGVDGDGHVYGVETLGHEVGMGDLILALRWYQGQEGQRDAAG